MLLKRGLLEKIRSGAVTLVFRRWRRPTVRAGGSLRTAVGVLAIERVDPVRPEDISDEDAGGAGYESPDALRRALATPPDGQVYRIALRWAGEDPRIALRAETDFDPDALAKLRAALAKLDSTSRGGAWTMAVLRLIAAREAMPAAEIARRLELDKLDLKRRIRSLKALGLTESLDVGYRLSPRGRAFMARGEA